MAKFANELRSRKRKGELDEREMKVAGRSDQVRAVSVGRGGRRCMGKVVLTRLKKMGREGLLSRGK
eukprot:760257-Hanusia_phi.AAC.2